MLLTLIVDLVEVVKLVVDCSDGGHLFCLLVHVLLVGLLMDQLVVLDRVFLYQLGVSLCSICHPLRHLVDSLLWHEVKLWVLLVLAVTSWACVTS